MGVQIFVQLLRKLRSTVSFGTIVLDISFGSFIAVLKHYFLLFYNILRGNAFLTFPAFL
jgi:hypothetical protein